MNELTPFTAFGPVHIGVLIVVAFVVVILPLQARRLDCRGRQYMARAIAAALLLNEAGKIVIRVYGYGDPLRSALPLHLCAIAALLTAWMLLSRRYRLYEVVYFWGVGGSIPAMITPDLPVGFPHPIFIVFFAGHGLTLLGVSYATVVYGYRPVRHSIGKTLVATLLLVVIMTPVNLLLDTNYLYLRAKTGPAHANGFPGSLALVSVCIGRYHCGDLSDCLYAVRIAIPSA